MGWSRRSNANRIVKPGNLSGPCPAFAMAPSIDGATAFGSHLGVTLYVFQSTLLIP